MLLVSALYIHRIAPITFDISYSIENNCGYIGYINETGNIDYNEELMKYFHSTEGITLDSLEKTKRR